MATRKSKQITDAKEIEYILGLTEDDLLHTHVVMELFGDFKGDGTSRFKPYDTFIVPPGHYTLKDGKKNSKPCLTTVGLWCYNKCFIEPDFHHIFGYINHGLNKDDIEDIDAELAYALLENDITVEQLQRHINKGQFYMKFEAMLSPCISYDILTLNDKVAAKKKQLIKENEEELLVKKNGQVAGKIEKELIDYSKTLVQDDESFDNFLSGSGAKFGNQYKNMFIWRGAIQDPNPDKGYNIITSSYMDSITKDEFVDTANSLATGPYSRNKKTQLGGYWEKLVLSATQHLVLDKPGSDCKTKHTIEVTLTKAAINDFMYSFIVEGNKLVELTRKNKDKYLGKKVKMRYSAMCQNKGKDNCICNMCMGNLPYRLSTNSDDTKYIHNIGAATPQLMSKLKNINMKAFHESLVTFVEMDPMEAFEGKY